MKKSLNRSLLGINRLKLAEYEDNIARKQSPDLIDLIAVIFSLVTK